MSRRGAGHEGTGKVLAEDLEVPGLIGISIGLMFRRTLAPGRGMWLAPCNGIHMMFMRFPIDAVFLDSNERVKKVYRRLPPWYGVVWLVWGAHRLLGPPPGP